MDQQVPTLTFDNQTYSVDLHELRNFLSNCREFMEVDAESFSIMTQVIADNLIDCAPPELTVQELKPQLKFLREVGFFLRSMADSTEQSSDTTSGSPD